MKFDGVKKVDEGRFISRYDLYYTTEDDKKKVYEMIRRKKVSPEKEGMVHFAGLVLLMALMVIVMANDIKNIFFI